MSNLQMDSSDEDYVPNTKYHRNSCPTKALAFSSKFIADSNPFSNESQGSPKKSSKRSSKGKTKGNMGNFNTGRWSKEEHQKFLEAIKIHGRDWKKVQDYVGTRTSTQARSHAQKVLPHPSWAEAINGSHNSTSTTFTKNSPASNKNDANYENRKCESVASDEIGSEFAIFKVEKIRKPIIGRDRVNSENNVFSFPVDNNNFGSYQDRPQRHTNRKYSMNIEFHDPKNDLIGSPIKESIKEHLGEDDEDDFREPFPEVPFTKHKTWTPKVPEPFHENNLFSLNNKANDLNLDTFDKQSPPDFPMDVDEGLAPWNSLHIMNDRMHKDPSEKPMDQDDDLGFSMDMDIEDNYYHITPNFDSNPCNLLN